MKTKNRIWLCSLIIIGFILILTNSCKKDNNNSFSMTDRDGNVYTSVTIGTQVWMVENLKTTKYRNGDLIGTTTTKDISAEATPKYQWAYDDNVNNVAVYGRLYTWFAVTDCRNVCPAGWHVPSNPEWIELETYLGGEEIAGSKLKETGTTHWLSPNWGATNETGFTALPGGHHISDGSFYEVYQNIRTYGYWWSSSEYSIRSDAYFRWMKFDLSNLVMVANIKLYGFSVRCLRDD